MGERRLVLAPAMPRHQPCRRTLASPTHLELVIQALEGVVVAHACGIEQLLQFAPVASRLRKAAMWQGRGKVEGR